MNNFVPPLIISIFYTACTHPLQSSFSNSTVEKTISTIVLLKNNKEHNAIIVSTNKSQKNLNRPREFVDIKEKNKILDDAKIMSEEELQRRFGDILSIHIPTPTSFRLYLEKDKLELTSSSKRLINGIVHEIIDKAPCVTDIIGHTDTVGAEEENLKKSLKQASYVESILKEEILNNLTGIKNISLKTKGYGEFDLLVPTANNIAEEKNRNVEVVIK